ncbi:hypothetical protein D3C85_810790 [compost metagenome]
MALKQQPPGHCRREDHDDDIELVLPDIKECQGGSENRQARRQRWNTFSSHLCQVDGGGANQADYPGRHTVEKGVQSLVLHNRLQAVVEDQREREGRQKDANCHGHRTDRATCHIADEGGEDDEWRRKHAGKRQAVQKLPIRHPPAPDSVVANERNRRVGTAEG